MANPPCTLSSSGLNFQECTLILSKITEFTNVLYEKSCGQHCLYQSALILVHLIHVLPPEICKKNICSILENLEYGLHKTPI
jgi:hypothetical protein